MIRGAADAIEFYKKAFGATETMRDTDADGKVRHAEIRIGDSQVMIADESPQFPELRSVQAFGGSPMNMFLYVDDAGALVKQALAAGAKLIIEVQDKPACAAIHAEPGDHGRDSTGRRTHLRPGARARVRAAAEAEYR